MGICSSKPPKPNPYASREELEASQNPKPSPAHSNAGTKDETELVKKSPFFPFYSPSPAHYLFSKKSPATNRSANSTPSRFLKKPFPPPSPAKHIKSFLARRHGKKVDAATIPEGDEGEAAECVVGVAGLDRNFGFSKQFTSKYELGEEVGRGHFGYTCSAKFKKGDLKGQQVAVKVIPKAKISAAKIELSCLSAN